MTKWTTLSIYSWLASLCGWFTRNWWKTSWRRLKILSNDQQSLGFCFTMFNRAFFFLFSTFLICLRLTTRKKERKSPLNIFMLLFWPQQSLTLPPNAYLYVINTALSLRGQTKTIEYLLAFYPKEFFRLACNLKQHTSLLFNFYNVSHKSW